MPTERQSRRRRGIGPEHSGIGNTLEFKAGPTSVGHNLHENPQNTSAAKKPGSKADPEVPSAKQKLIESPPNALAAENTGFQGNPIATSAAQNLSNENTRKAPATDGPGFIADPRTFSAEQNLHNENPREASATDGPRFQADPRAFSAEQDLQKQNLYNAPFTGYSPKAVSFGKSSLLVGRPQGPELGSGLNASSDHEQPVSTHLATPAEQDQLLARRRPYVSHSGPVGERPTSTKTGCCDWHMDHRPDSPFWTPERHGEHEKWVNKTVLEYLNKKGYSKSEAMLRMESNTEGGPLQTRADDPIGGKYIRSYELMVSHIENVLDIYKADLRRFRWPVFVYSFLQLVNDGHSADSRTFFQRFRYIFDSEHQNDLQELQSIHLPEHLSSNPTAKTFLSNKYRLRVNVTAFNTLVLFLESANKEGSAVLVHIIQTKLQTVTFENSGENQSFLARLLDRARQLENYPAEDEGIPGHNAGSANTDQAPGSTVLARLRLGPLPMDPDFVGEVRANLSEEDNKYPPTEGQSSLSHHFDQQIKREESEDAPSRTELPLPASTIRDIAMEVQKVKENRDRFKIESRTGGVGPAVSVLMFTFHNTHDSINCLDFSQDNVLVAAGMSESYIRVWTLNGEALPAVGSQANGNTQPSNSRRLIGHSGPVYNVSFSPSAQPLSISNSASNTTASKYLLSCSADKTVRLWSLDTWTCVVVYKEHNAIVWDVRWGPFGHYFLTGAGDRTARLWSTDRIESLRMFVGHDNDVDVVCFHPNNAYVFTGSCDRTIRMWKVTDGVAVRMFTGHTGNITSIACSPSGKILASADDQGTIILWDLTPGKLLKRMRGHQKGGIWSLTWSVESTVLVSGSGDGTVRVWDVVVPNDAAGGQGRVIGEGGAGTKISGDAQVQGAGGKKKGKEVVVTSDQISAFPTKKSPVFKVHCTRQNLILAGGCYMP